MTHGDKSMAPTLSLNLTSNRFHLTSKTKCQEATATATMSMTWKSKQI